MQVILGLCEEIQAAIAKSLAARLRRLLAQTRWLPSEAPLRRAAHKEAPARESTLCQRLRDTNAWLRDLEGTLATAPRVLRHVGSVHTGCDCSFVLLSAKSTKDRGLHRAGAQRGHACFFPKAPVTCVKNERPAKLTPPALAISKVRVPWLV